MLPSTPRNACWTCIEATKGTLDKWDRCRLSPWTSTLLGRSISEMVIVPSDNNTAFGARSAVVRGGAAGRTEPSEHQDFEDASLIHIDNILNQVCFFQVLNQSEKNWHYYHYLWYHSGYNSCDDAKTTFCVDAYAFVLSGPKLPASAEGMSLRRLHRNLQRGHLHSELCNFRKDMFEMFNPNMSNCFGLTYRSGSRKWMHWKHGATPKWWRAGRSHGETPLAFSVQVNWAHWFANSKDDAQRNWKLVSYACRRYAVDKWTQVREVFSSGGQHLKGIPSLHGTCTTKWSCPFPHSVCWKQNGGLWQKSCHESLGPVNFDKHVHAPIFGSSVLPTWRFEQNMKKHGRTCLHRHVRLDLDRMAMFGTAFPMLAHASCICPSLEPRRPCSICGVWISVFCRDDTPWYQQFTNGLHSAECAKAAKTCDASEIRNGDESRSRAGHLVEEGASSFPVSFRVKFLGITIIKLQQRMSMPQSTAWNGYLLFCWPRRFTKPMPQVSLLSVLSKTTATVFKASVLKSLAILQIKLGTTWNRLKVSAHPRFPATKSVRLPAFYLKSSQLETLCNFARHGVGWTHAGQTFCTSNSKH